MLKQYQPIILQLMRFGVVGLTAASVNFLLVVIFVETLHWRPLLANLLAFVIAYQVSFAGHNFWTFKSNLSKKSVWCRFFLVAIISLALNEGLFYVFLHPFGLYYPIALLITLILVPPVTFVLGKYWAFN